MKKYFLPLGLLVALFSALFLPTVGIYIATHSGIRVLIALIFLISGYQTTLHEIRCTGNLLLIFLTAAIISLCIGPLLGIACAATVQLPAAINAGLIIIASMPPTISSGIVLTSLSRGNTLLAMLLTIGLNLLAIVTIPLTLSYGLQAAGPMEVDQRAMLATMIFLVMLPFTAGNIFRRLANSTTVSENWTYVNTSCVIFVVYSSLAVSADTLLELAVRDLLIIATLAMTVHLLLLGVSVLAGKVLAMKTADIKAISFVASQKTLAMALAVVTSISINSGRAILVCLIFHFLQIFTDSFLASWWQHTGDKQQNMLKQSRF